MPPVALNFRYRMRSQTYTSSNDVLPNLRFQGLKKRDRLSSPGYRSYRHFLDFLPAMGHYSKGREIRMLGVKEVFSSVGQVAGIAGISVVTFLFVAKAMLQRVNWPAPTKASA
jgi:hypothetical protein